MSLHCVLSVQISTSKRCQIKLAECQTRSDEFTCELALHPVKSTYCFILRSSQVWHVHMFHSKQARTHTHKHKLADSRLHSHGASTVCFDLEGQTVCMFCLKSCVMHFIKHACDINMLLFAAQDAVTALHHLRRLSWQAQYQVIQNTHIHLSLFVSESGDSKYTHTPIYICIHVHKAYGG